MGKGFRFWVTKSSRFGRGPKENNHDGKPSLGDRFLVPDSIPSRTTASNASTSSFVSTNSRTILAAELPPSSADSQRSNSPQPSQPVFKHPSIDARYIIVPPTSAGTRSATVDLWALARQNLAEQDLKGFDQLFPVPSATKDYSSLMKQLSEMINKYQSSQWRHERKDGSKIVIRNVMDKVLVWADTLKDIGNSLTGLDPTGHAAQVWGGLQLVVAAAVRNISTRELVFNVERITKSIKRCTIFESLYNLNVLEPLTDAKQELKDAQIQLYCQVFIYLIAAIKYVHQGSWKHGFNALVSKDPVTDAMSAIESASRKVEQWAKLVNKEDSMHANQTIDEVKKKQLELLKNIGNPVLATADQVGFIRDEVHSQRQERILNWVSTILPANRHMTIQRQRKDGTGDWLLSHGAYECWRSSPKSCSLWMYGKAGYGKSILVSKVIDDVEKSCEEEKTKYFAFPNPNPDRMAYYYCDKANNAAELEDALTILRSLLRQLSTLGGYPLMRLIVEKFESIHEQRHISEEECKDLIVALCDIYPTTILVLDGMDECKHDVRESLIESIQEIMSRTRGTLKLFISSRFEGDIELALKDVDYRIGLNAADNEGDITLFVVDRVANSIGRGLPRTLTTEQQETVIRVLIRKADGMFLWVQLSLAALRKHRTPDDVMENVGLLPPGLNPIYAQIMDEINSFSRHTLELIRRTLNLLLYQQAKLDQVEFIRFISPGITDVDIKAKAIDIVDACRHLIEVDLVRNSFRLAHASVKEYLVEVYSKKDSQKEYLPNQGNAAISKMCIQILQNVVDSTYCRHGAAYAESFWIYHLAECTDLRAQDTALKTILDECHVTADTPSWLKQWLRATRLPTLTSIDSSSHKHIYEVKYAASHSLIATSLFLVCAFGFGELLCDADVLPLNLLQLNNIWEESPLTVSIEYGHLSIARQLIGKIEQTQTLDQNFSQWRQSELTQALCCAAKYGRQDVLDLIIKAGADVNTKNTDGVTPLQSAVLNGQVQVLKKLMRDHGVSGTATDARGNSILMQAISRNHPECVELLLAEVTDIEIPNKVGDGSLHKAAAVGNCWVIEMLLQKNGNLEARNRMGETPLHVASARNSLKVVQLLVDGGARTDSRDVEGKSPLHVAAENGRAEIVRYLVTSNCDIELRDERGMSPLHYAVLASHTVVGILIAAGADVDAETKDGETPYLLAVRMNRVADIRLTRSEHTI